MIILNKKER